MALKRSPEYNGIHEFRIFRLGATTTDLPPGVLYRVKATYKYVKEDQDELSFDVGEIINVIEYDDPDDQVSKKTWSLAVPVAWTRGKLDHVAWPLDHRPETPSALFWNYF